MSRQVIEVNYRTLLIADTGAMAEDLLRAVQEYDPNQSHAFRDGHTVGGSRLLVSSKILSDEEFEKYCEELEKQGSQFNGHGYKKE
jgi:hypothetical protein